MDQKSSTPVNSIDIRLFPQEPYPSSLPVVPIDKHGDGWEYDEAARFFTGKRISDITYEALKSKYKKDWTSIHYLFSPQALAFFLPALMKVAQDHYNDHTHNASVLADNLTFFFCRMSRRELDYHLLPLIQSYSKSQLAAIAKFLREMSEQHYRGMGELDDAAEALRLFWGQYEV